MKVLTVLVLVSFTIGSVAARTCPDAWIHYGQSCYLFSDLSADFTEAEEFCRHHNAYLVHIESHSENLFLQQYLHLIKGGDYWIGLTDQAIEGIWRWYPSGRTLGYSDWTPGQPDNENFHHLAQDCVLIWAKHGYHWDDAACDKDIIHPLCELNDESEAIVG